MERVLWSLIRYLDVQTFETLSRTSKSLASFMKNSRKYWIFHSNYCRNLGFLSAQETLDFLRILIHWDSFLFNHIYMQMPLKAKEKAFLTSIKNGDVRMIKRLVACTPEEDKRIPLKFCNEQHLSNLAQRLTKSRSLNELPVEEEYQEYVASNFMRSALRYSVIMGDTIITEILLKCGSR